MGEEEEEEAEEAEQNGAAPLPGAAGAGAERSTSAAPRPPPKLGELPQSYLMHQNNASCTVARRLPPARGPSAAPRRRRGRLVSSWVRKLEAH